jgi:hypothetical protein
MIRSLLVLATSLLFLTCAATAAETPPAVQIFACNFLDGKDVADLDEATDFFKAQIAKIGSADLTAYEAFVWEPYVGRTDYDFLWFGAHANLNTLVRAQAALDDSAEGQAANTKFDAIVKCDSAIAFSEVIYDGEGEPVSDGQALLESYVCQLRQGKTLDDARAVVKDWSALMETLPSTGSLTALMRHPFIANTPIDLSYVLVHDDLTQFGQRTTDYQNAGGDKLDARFDEVHNCESSLWTGRRVVTAPE